MGSRRAMLSTARCSRSCKTVPGESSPHVLLCLPARGEVLGGKEVLQVTRYAPKCLAGGCWRCVKLLRVLETTG